MAHRHSGECRPVASSRTCSAAGLLLVVLVAVLAACGTSAPPSAATSAAAPSNGAVVTRSYVGTVPGTSGFVSVVADGTRAMAYLCDGVPGSGKPPTFQAWLSGASDGTTVDLTQPSGRLQLQLTESAFTGTFTPTGRSSIPLTGNVVSGDAGLYRAEGGGTLAGWILAANGEQRGAARDTSGSGFAVPRLQPNQTTISFQTLSNAKIGQVGITLIPIP